MTHQQLNTILDELLEPLAELEHSRWSHWQSYVHTRARRLDDGSLVIPKDLVDRWNGQIRRDYRELTEAEKQSDREQALKTILLLKERIKLD